MRTIEELKAIMENGLAHSGEMIENPFYVWNNKTEHGYVVAAEAGKQAVKTFGKYTPYRGYGNVSYHEIVFKTPITAEDTDAFGYWPSVSVRVDYWGYIICHSENGSGVGERIPNPNLLRLIMDRIVEALS